MTCTMHMHCVDFFFVLFHDFCCSSKSKGIFFSFSSFLSFFMLKSAFCLPQSPTMSAFGHPQSSTHLFADVINGWYLYQKFKLYCTHSSFSIKVHIFWESREILRNLPLTFDSMYCSQKLGVDFAKFCGLLRIYEL